MILLKFALGTASAELKRSYQVLFRRGSKALAISLKNNGKFENINFFQVAIYFNSHCPKATINSLFICMSLPTKQLLLLTDVFWLIMKVAKVGDTAPLTVQVCSDHFNSFVVSLSTWTNSEAPKI